MKTIKILFSSAFALMLFTFSQCKKNKTEEPQLPPETTTGAMTFGCKIDGKVFVPKDGRGKPGLFCQYVNLGTGSGGGWFLNVPATDWASGSLTSVNIETDSLLFIEGQTYQFKNQKGFPRAFHQKESGGGVISFPKIDTETGNIVIKRHDVSQRILSATFSFVGTNLTNGEKVDITEGRFDIRY